jgi:hypothetical protein
MIKRSCKKSDKNAKKPVFYRIVGVFQKSAATVVYSWPLELLSSLSLVGIRHTGFPGHFGLGRQAFGLDVAVITNPHFSPDRYISRQCATASQKQCLLETPFIAWLAPSSGTLW